MINEDPLFIDPDNENYHLQFGPILDYPCIDAGDPTILDACIPPGLGSTTSDMGAYGGEENCGWYDSPYDLLLSPEGTVTVPRGGVLEFNVLVYNLSPNIVEGDLWFSVLLSNEIEVFIPENLLSLNNPQHGKIIFGNHIELLSQELFIPAPANTGTYCLIGRIGNYPGRIVDEDSVFGLSSNCRNRLCPGGC